MAGPGGKEGQRVEQVEPVLSEQSEALPAHLKLRPSPRDLRALGGRRGPPHTCGTLRPASASKAGHPQKACSGALAADGPRSRQLRENESRRQACSSNPFSLKHGQERGCGHRPNGALGLEISPFSSQKQIVKQLFKKKKIRKQTFGSI